MPLVGSWSSPDIRIIRNFPPMMALALALGALGAVSAAVDLARPSARETPSAKQLSASPNIWLAPAFLTAEEVSHLRTRVPVDESAYAPCIGQLDEFDSKKCTFVRVAGDSMLEGVATRLSRAWNVDVSRLVRGGLPIIRYLPGAPPVGKHGDEDRHGVVPNATLVIYLTESSGGNGAGGQTLFPDAGVAVTPSAGAVLAFQNVDAAGAPHPKAKHLVSAVPADAKGDRLVVQVPIAYWSGTPAYAYPEHVSGNKKPGEHEALHGNASQKGAYGAAVAAGVSIAVAFMAAKVGKFEVGDVPALEAQAQQTGGFKPEDFEVKKQ